MAKLKRILQIGLLTSIVAAAGINHRYNSIKERMKDCLPDRIKLHEKALGVEYPSHPKLKLTYPPSKSFIPNIALVGQYSPGEQTIYLPLASPFNLMPGFSPEGHLDHELGHHYLFHLAKQITNGEHKQDTIGEKFVDEGMAEYISQKVDKSTKGTRDYKAALDFVKPIIDKYGRRGMEYLITNPPKKEELEFTEIFIRLTDSESTQKRYLEHLANSPLH